LQSGAKVMSILIVDDHALTRSAVVALLSEALPDWLLLTAGSGEEAVRQCESHEPTMIVMDISMPGIDGIEATRRVKRQYPDTLVIMHSVNDLPIYRTEATAAGASGFVSKARTGRDLLPLIKSLLPQTTS